MREYKEQMRIAARVPSRAVFPYKPSKMWDAAKTAGPPKYTYFPVKARVDMFTTAEDGSVEWTKTDLRHEDLTQRASIKDTRTFNRTKGVVEYADLQRPTNERWNKDFHEAMNLNERAFYRRSGEVVGFVDLMVRQGYKLGGTGH